MINCCYNLGWDFFCVCMRGTFIFYVTMLTALIRTLKLLIITIVSGLIFILLHQTTYFSDKIPKWYKVLNIGSSTSQALKMMSMSETETCLHLVGSESDSDTDSSNPLCDWTLSVRPLERRFVKSKSKITSQPGRRERIAVVVSGQLRPGWEVMTKNSILWFKALNEDLYDIDIFVSLWGKRTN